MLQYLKEYINFNDYDTDETYDSPLTDKGFVKFLKENNIYNKFMDNIREEIIEHGKYWSYWRSIENFCNIITDYAYIVSAFFWPDTPEGVIFWNKYDRMWRNYLLKSKLKM